LKQFSYEPERLADDLYAIPLPLHDGSPVNAYVAVAQDGLWLIDGGLDTEECQSILRAGIARLGYALARDVRGLLITHGHNDHVGAAESVLESGGEVLAHRLEATRGRNVGFDLSWLQRNGLPADGYVQDRWRTPVWPDPTRLLEDGESLRWGNLDLQVVWCPGHTPGLVCLYEASRALLFTTDHVMRRAPAPIGVRSGDGENPLREYLESVAKLKSLNVETVLPGHGRPFHHLRQRLHDIEREISGQLQAIVERLEHGPASAYELIQSLGVLRDRRPMAARYQLSLALARLRFLEELGRVTRHELDGPIKYGMAG
jgi:glyoxylase-like metal-dependent hydrolase (beta-lactamase superfamily II)